MDRIGTSLGLLVVVLSQAGAARAQVLHVAELSSEAIRGLDRERTAVLLPGGILEQHGPYLPSFTDGYTNEYLTRRLAEAIVARPGWTALVFPTIPLGTGGANEIGHKHVFPGTYAVRSTTLRAVFMDLLVELGEQGFRRGFIVHGHGAPNHNRMLHQASDFFHDTYGGQIVHLLGLDLPLPDDSAWSPAEREGEGLSVHAGAAETSGVLFLRPDLVEPAHRKAPPQTGRSWEDLVALARAPEWPGYFGSPRLATAAHGAGPRSTAALVEFALKILDGLDSRQFRRPGDLVKSAHPTSVAIDEAALAREREVFRQQQAWLKGRGLE